MIGGVRSRLRRSGWRVIVRPPVYFRRTRGTLSLPEPVAGGALDPLLELLNVVPRTTARS